MPDMKLILERWDSYLIFEEDTLSQLKDDPAAVEELADDVARIKDRKRLQAVLSALADGGMLSTILKATGKTDFESVLGVMGAGAEGAVTEKKWNY